MFFSFFFRELKDHDSGSVHKNAKKKKELNQYPAILTWHLGHNPYVYRLRSKLGSRREVLKDYLPLGPREAQSWALETKCLRSLWCASHATVSGDYEVPWKVEIFLFHHDDSLWTPGSQKKLCIFSLNKFLVKQNCPHKAGWIIKLRTSEKR